MSRPLTPADLIHHARNLGNVFARDALRAGDDVAKRERFMKASAEWFTIAELFERNVS